MPQVLYNRGIQAPAVVAPPATIWFGATVPTAPQVVPTRAYSWPSAASTNHGSYYTPANQSAAQTAINTAAAAAGTGGDVIILTAGTNYGSLTLPAHGTGNGTIYIVSSQIPDLAGALPASGTRVGPGNVSNMPILSGSGSYIISDNGTASLPRITID